MKSIFFLLWILIPGLAFSHGKEVHQSKDESSISVQAILSDTHKIKIFQVRQSYQKEIEPIFKLKCFDCHGDKTDYPWYYMLPGVKQIIEKDILEAKKHLDISKGFPFGGHGTPKQDLESIQKSTKKGSMPPFLYRISHENSALTENEKETVLILIDKSLKQLNEQ